MRILVAEDEKDLNRIIVKKLQNCGYGVDSCLNGTDAYDYLSAAKYDCAVLDIMMPGMSGLEVVEKIRRDGNSVPVLFLTAKDSISDRVTGLDAGADDYLVKPFAFDELLARVRVMTRRSAEVKSTTNVYTVADLSVDCNSHTVTRGGREIALSAREFSILEYLIRNKGIVLSREKIENNIWNFDYEAGSNVVDVYIRYLRKKIDDGFEQKLIHTVRGTGYVLREG